MKLALLDQFNGKLGPMNIYTESTQKQKANNEEESYFTEISASDDTEEYSEMIEGNVFIGEYTYSSIIEGLNSQFDDYIGTDDKNNYAEIFYSQWHDSIETFLTDEEEEHPLEIKEALNRILDKFTSYMYAQFRQKLTLTIMAIDEGETNSEAMEGCIRLLYEYFILDAKKNFKKAISQDIERRIVWTKGDMTDAIKEFLYDYSGMILVIGPREFLRMTANEDILKLFDDGDITGNFFRRYSPKLYDHPDFESDIIAEIILRHDVKGDFKNAYLGQ